MSASNTAGRLRPERDRRALPDREEARGRRHGHRVQGQGQGARAHGRDQDHPAGGPRRLDGVARGPAEALQAGGAGRGAAPAHQHSDALRRRHLGGLELHLDGVRGRRGARWSDQGLREDGDRARRRDRRPGGRGARCRAQARHRAPRHQARQHHDRAGRPREGRGLRDRQVCGLGRALDGHRQPAGDALVHEPGAGEGPPPRRAQRPVLGRLRPVRDGRGATCVPRRLDHGASVQDHLRGAALAARARPDGLGRDAADHRQGALEGGRDALPERPRARRRSARHHPAGLRADAACERDLHAAAGRASRRRAHDLVAGHGPGPAHDRIRGYRCCGACRGADDPDTGDGSNGAAAPAARNPRRHSTRPRSPRRPRGAPAVARG